MVKNIPGAVVVIYVGAKIILFPRLIYINNILADVLFPLKVRGE